MLGYPVMGVPDFEAFAPDKGIVYQSPPGSPTPIFSTEDELFAPVRGTVLAPARVLLPDTTPLMLELERFNGDGVTRSWGDVEVSVSLVPTHQAPVRRPATGDPQEWAGVSLRALQEYPGARVRYRVSYPLVQGQIPGAQTLESGVEYGVWVMLICGQTTQVQCIGSVYCIGA